MDEPEKGSCSISILFAALTPDFDSGGTDQEKAVS